MSDFNDLLEPPATSALKEKEPGSGRNLVNALTEIVTEKGATEALNGGARLSASLAAAEFVKSLRRETGLSQTDLSAITGIRQASISDIERARLENGPTIGTLAVLARACGRDLKLTF